MTYPTLLQVDSLALRFGGVTAIDSISLHLHKHEILGLIGPNGAGKTSVFNCITGFERASDGRIELDNQDVTRKRPYRVSRLGIRRTFQNVRLFPHLSVRANILAGVHTVARHDDEFTDAVLSLCRELHLSADLLDRIAGDLPYGLQRRVEVARALIANPRVLLVDEPGAGLNMQEKVLIVDLLRAAAREREVGIMLIEHDMGMIAQACDRVIVLDHGKVIAEGTPDEVRADPLVVEAYLGSEDDVAHS